MDPSGMAGIEPWHGDDNQDIAGMKKQAAIEKAEKEKAAKEKEVKDNKEHPATELAGQGINISLSFVPIMGMGVSFSAFSLNRGPDANKTFFSFSITARVGGEIGISGSGFQIASKLSNNKLNASTIEGYGVDISASYGAGNLSGGFSLPTGKTNATDFMIVPAFLGGGVGGGGAKTGLSIGFGQTFLLNK